MITEFALRAAGRVKALLDALEAKDKQIASLNGALNTASLRLADAEDRIAELEDRTAQPCQHSMFWDASGIRRCSKCDKAQLEAQTEQQTVAWPVIPDHAFYTISHKWTLSADQFKRLYQDLQAVVPAPPAPAPVTVKLRKFSVGEVMHMSGFSRDYAEGWCAGNDNARKEIQAAGIKIAEGE